MGPTNRKGEFMKYEDWIKYEKERLEQLEHPPPLSTEELIEDLKQAEAMEDQLRKELGYTDEDN